VITGTGTDIGKTVVAAGLAGLLGAAYWKPVQTGVTVPPGAAPEDFGDSATVAVLAGVRVLPPAVTLPEPLSPHRAAELAGRTIDPYILTLPEPDPLIVEGAGGVLVPVTRTLLSADLFARWGLPVVLVAATGLGTISATLTAIEALRARNLRLHGLAFCGEEDPDNIATIAAFSGARVLGRLPRLDPLTPQALAAATRAAFRPEDFA